MKTKFKIELISLCDLSEKIVNLISRHNSEQCNFSLSDLSTFINMYHNLYPNVFRSKATINKEDNTLSVSDDTGKSTALIVTEVEIYELDSQVSSDTYYDVTDNSIH